MRLLIGNDLQQRNLLEVSVEGGAQLSKAASTERVLSKQRPVPAISPVQSERVGAVQVLHCSVCLSVWAVGKEMIVVGHQAVGMNLQARTLTSFGQAPKKEAPVGVLSEDRLAPGSAVHQVVPAPRIIKSWFTCHRYCIRSSVDFGKRQGEDCSR